MTCDSMTILLQREARTVGHLKVSPRTQCNKQKNSLIRIFTLVELFYFLWVA